MEAKKLDKHLKQLEILDMYFHSDVGPYFNLSMLQLEYDRYKEIAPGVWDRLVSDRNDIIEAREEIFRKQINSMDFSKFTVILNFAEAGITFQKHHHRETERLYCYSGEFEDRVSGATVRSGEAIEFLPLQPHEIHFNEDTAILMTLQPLAFSKH